MQEDELKDQSHMINENTFYRWNSNFKRKIFYI